MLLHFQVLFHAIIFALVMEASVLKSNWTYFLGFLLIVIALWSIKKITKRFLFFIVPAILAVSTIMMLYLIDLPIEKHIFITLSTLIYYLALLGVYRLKGYSKDQTARGMISASAMTSLFFFYTASYGIYLNFSIPLWILMVVYLLVTILVSYEYFNIISPQKRKIWSYSIILGMIMAEIAWVINFWPFGYLTTGVLVLVFYYIFWDLTQTYLLNILSQKRLMANLAFFSAVAGLVLMTSRWLPVV